MSAFISSTRSINKNSREFYKFTSSVPYHYGHGERSELWSKLVLDYLLAVSALLILAPLFCGLSLAIKVDSSGPLFYRRRILGRNGRIFYAYHFRTLSVNTKRQTRVGRFLIQTKLVELPLLINILKNEISFVGPRAVSPEQIVLYGAHADRLLSVTPGITGFWQVNGHQKENRVEQDMQYIEHCSLLNDLAILFKTVTAVFHHRN
jgi:lipopolysaccharide/colanic/teichoic acid biosynthesis glycosyltransferase